MAWPARTWVAGEVVTANLLNTYVRDALASIGAAWTPYTCTWGAATTNPVIGNGTIVAAYMQAGKLTAYRIRITAGSTTTFGSGTYTFTLPFNTTLGGSGVSLGTGVVGQGSTFYGRNAASIAAASIVLVDNAGARISSTVPATLASGNTIDIMGTYEAA